MSAWIASNKHIDVVVFGAVKNGLTTDPDAIGVMLLTENFASVNYRYSESEPVSPYSYTKPEPEPTSAEILKLADSLDYQSCEHPGWSKSAACALLIALVEAESGGDAEYGSTAEYGTAAWSL